MIFIVEDAYGNQLTTGLDSFHVDRVAQLMANARNESVFVSRVGSADQTYEVAPEKEDETK